MRHWCSFQGKTNRVLQYLPWEWWYQCLQTIVLVDRAWPGWQHQGWVPGGVCSELSCQGIPAVCPGSNSLMALAQLWPHALVMPLMGWMLWLSSWAHIPVPVLWIQQGSLAGVVEELSSGAVGSNITQLQRHFAPSSVSVAKKERI